MKKLICIMVLALLVIVIPCVSVMAADTIKADGFYDIGTNDDVEIKPFKGDTEVSVTLKNLDDDEDDEKWYMNSDRLEVTYKAAVEGEYYGVIMVEGSGLPTVDTDIYYIDQVEAEGSNINFNVYPILPTDTTDISLYISTSMQGADLVKIPLNYAADVEMLTYTLGDIDNDGNFGVKDALIVLQIGVGKYPATEAQRIAADVDGDGVCGVKDALLILQYGTGKINSFK